MPRHSRPRDSGRLRQVRPEVQTKPCSDQQVPCFFADGARATEDHVSTNPFKEALRPEESITHGLANLPEEMSVEPCDLSHGLGQIECQYLMWRFSKRVDAPARLSHHHKSICTITCAMLGYEET